MFLKSINLKRIAVRGAITKGYLSAKTAISPAYQSAKESLEKNKEYINPVGAGLYLGSLATAGSKASFRFGKRHIKLAKVTRKASGIYGSSEIPVEILQIIRKAYTSDAFYKASWKIKSQILARRIVRSKTIQRNIAEATLAQIIYIIIHNHKNRQGNEKLAEDISKVVSEKQK